MAPFGNKYHVWFVFSGVIAYKGHSTRRNDREEHNMVYALITADGVDQIVETYETAIRERRDLLNFYDKVTIRRFASWEAAEEFADKFRD
jgi:hypothetical protein